MGGPLSVSPWGTQVTEPISLRNPVMAILPQKTVHCLELLGLTLDSLRHKSNSSLMLFIFHPNTMLRNGDCF